MQLTVLPPDIPPPDIGDESRMKCTTGETPWASDDECHFLDQLHAT